MPIVEPARRTEVLAEHEVVILGGGPAGIAAAAAAARAGRSAMLVERYGFLGGAGTAAGLANFCGLHAKVNPWGGRKYDRPWDGSFLSRNLRERRK